jgi:hypothetical protein
MRIHGKSLGNLNIEVSEIELVHSIDPKDVANIEAKYKAKIDNATKE